MTSVETRVGKSHFVDLAVNGRTVL